MKSITISKEENGIPVYMGHIEDIYGNLTFTAYFGTFKDWNGIELIRQPTCLFGTLNKPGEQYREVMIGFNFNYLHITFKSEREKPGGTHHHQQIVFIKEIADYIRQS